MFNDCQFLMFYLQFIFRQFILTIIIFIIMESVSPPPGWAAGANCSKNLASKMQLMYWVWLCPDPLDELTTWTEYALRKSH